MLVSDAFLIMPTLLWITAAGKKAKKKSKGKTLSLNDFLSDASSGTNYVKDPPKAPGTTNWADATEDLDPSGESKVYCIVLVFKLYVAMMYFVMHVSCSVANV